MRTIYGVTATAFLVAGAAAARAESSLSGDYVEARTANVYIGACHANGEAVTIGREAMLVWNVRRGASDGVRLDGLRAVAVVTGSDNLARDNVDRKAVVYVDARAAAAQRSALVSALEARYGRALGRVVAVKPATIEYGRDGLEYTVRIPGVAYLKTTRYACNHCVMPHSIWYQPLVDLKSSMVAMAAVNQYKGTPEMETSWMRTEENSSYIGEFAF